MITLHGLDSCDTCRKARNWLARFEIEHHFVDYRTQRIAPETLKSWAAQLGGWDKLINKASTTWRQWMGIAWVKSTPHAEAAVMQKARREVKRMIR